MRPFGFSSHHIPVVLVVGLMLAIAYLTSAHISERINEISAQSTESRRTEAFNLLANYSKLRELTHLSSVGVSHRFGELVLPIQGFIGNVEGLKSERFEIMLAEQDLGEAVEELSQLKQRLNWFVSGQSGAADFELFDEVVEVADAVDRVAQAINKEELRVLNKMSHRVRSTQDTILWMATIFLVLGGMFIAMTISRNRNLLAKTRALQASEKKLRDLSFYRQQFLANMSHEFRTPLNAIQGFSDIVLFQRDTITLEKTMEYIEIIQKSSKDLMKLTEDVLDLSKIDAGKFDLSLEDVNFTQLIDDAVVQFRAIAEHRQLKIESAIAAHWLVSCDRMALKRCFTNLLSNSVKFSEPGGVITVRAYLRNAKVFVVEVRDQGAGIPERDLQSIWMVYARSSLTRRSGVEGAGLGLALVKALMDAHNGFVELQSREGVGTSVRLCFPTTMIVATKTRALRQTPVLHDRRNSSASKRNLTG